MLKDGVDPRTGLPIGDKDATIKKQPGLAERNRIEDEFRG